MPEKLITIKDVALKNNCPECYNNNGLHLTFKQKFIESIFYKSITKETNIVLHCNTCENRIYPVNWNEDIERVVNYHQRAFSPKKASIKLKKSAWLLILAIIFLAIICLFLFFLNK